MACRIACVVEALAATLASTCDAVPLQQQTEALSLLQRGIRQRHADEFSSEGSSAAVWGGKDKPYYKCREVALGTWSRCRDQNSGMDREASYVLYRENHSKTVKRCAKSARKIGADTFNFFEDADTPCELLHCRNSDLLFEKAEDGQDWAVYSTFCGFEHVSKTVASAACGSQRTSYHVYRPPKHNTCKSVLSFTHVSGTNLTGAGMRFVDVLPKTDLVVTTVGPYAARKGQKKRNGVDGGFGVIYFKTNSNTHLHFKLVSSGSDAPTVVPVFAFTIADLVAGRRDRDACSAMTVNASRWASYHVTEDPQLAIKSELGDMHGRLPSIAFKAIGMGATSARPRGGVLTTEQAKRSATLVYEEVSEFDLFVSVLPGVPGERGRSLMLGGPMLTPCNQPVDP